MRRGLPAVGLVLALLACHPPATLSAASAGPRAKVPPRPGPRAVPPAPAEETAPVPVRPLPPAWQPAGGHAAARGTGSRLVLGAVGDILLQGEVQQSARTWGLTEAGEAEESEGFDALFAGLADELSHPDVLFANLETPVAPRDGQVRTGAFSFNAPLSAVRALEGAGMDLVSVANNHIYDRGRRGLTATLENLEALGLSHVGVGVPPLEAGPRVVEANGIRVAFLAWTQLLNRDFNDCGSSDCARVAVLREWEPVLEAVRRAAAEADAVVVSLHWGREYEAAPGTGEVALARKLCEAGARVVLGHHPHVLQPLELYRREDGTVSLIAYSLGNFISNQARGYQHRVSSPSDGDPRDGALVRAELHKRQLADGSWRTELVGVDALPLWTENERRRGQVPRIEVVALARARERVQQTLVAAGQLPAAARRRLEAQLLLYDERRGRIAERLGEAFLREPARPRALPVASAP